MKHWWHFVFAFGTLVFPLPATGQLRVTVDREYVIVREVAAGDSVAIIGVVQEFPGDTMHVRAPFLIGEDSDRDGEISLGDTEASRSNLLRAGFVAVEVSSGRHAIGASAGTRLRTGSGARIVMTDERDPKPSGIALQSRSVSAMFVRPGVGAWGGVVGDGSSFDADGRNDGFLVIDRASFVRPTDEARPPDAFQDGDLVVIIDMYSRDTHMIDVWALYSTALGEVD